MEHIKNEQEFCKKTEEFINFYGDSKLIADRLDELIFEYIEGLSVDQKIMSIRIANFIYLLKEIRNLFVSLETK
jgi:hypothetical protein